MPLEKHVWIPASSGLKGINSRRKQNILALHPFAKAQLQNVDHLFKCLEYMRVLGAFTQSELMAPISNRFSPLTSPPFNLSLITNSEKLMRGKSAEGTYTFELNL